MDILDLSTDPKQECFAAYLNMAQNNVFIAMKDIVERLGLKKTFYKNGKEGVNPFDESNCYDATILQDEYLKVLPDDQKEKLKQKLLRSFPFLVPMISTDRFYAFYNKHTLYYAKEKNEKEVSSDVTIRKEEELLQNSKIETIAKYLRNSLNVLSFYRNNASHTLPITEEIGMNIIPESNMIAIALDCVFKQACAVIKERFQLKGNEKYGKNLQFIQNARVLPKDIGKKDQKGKAIKIQVPNFNYSHCFYYKDNNEYTMSRMAVVYLICMFIEKSYATQFFCQISTEFYKGIYKNENYKMYLREIYSCYRMRISKNATNPYEGNIIFAMDILNELAKCPNELYECLCEEDQARFERDNSEHTDCPDRVLLRRSSDRFPELAMKWMDGASIFNNLRFNVIYGKYHEVFKDEQQKEHGIKKCCDGVERPRWITKELTTFGRIDDLENQRTGKTGDWDGKSLVKWLDNKVENETESDTVSETEDLSPWITDMCCQYVIKENNIGIKLSGDSTLPSIDGKTLKEIKTVAPDVWLSVYELPAMVFLTILSNGEAENKILGYQKKFQNFLSDLKSGAFGTFANREALENALKAKGLDIKDIPSKIIDCLLGKDQTKMLSKYANAFLRDELEHTRKRITDLNECKIGNEVIEPSRFLPGNIAKYLAADIVKYCKYDNGSDKPTGLNYNVMQSKLATFANKGQFAYIKAVFSQLNMLQGGKAEHPFLQKVIDFEPKNVEQFLAKYLTEKEAFLQKCELKQAKNSDACKSMHFLHPNRGKWQQRNIATIANEYLNLPVQLPKGLFDEAIKKQILKQCPQLNDKSFLTTSYMINAYMMSLKDDIQKFYGFGRSYPVFAKMDKAKPGRNPRENGEVIYRSKAELHKKGFFDTELQRYINTCRSNPRRHPNFDAENAEALLRRLFHDYDRTEKAITRYSVQDFLLMQIAKKLIFDTKDGKKTENDVSKLNIDMFKLREISPDFQGLLSESVSITLDIMDGYSVSWDTKIKDYARIFELYKDQRLVALLKLLPKGNYKAEDIQWEFGNYDRNRIEAFRLLLDFECKAVKIPSVKAALDKYISVNKHSTFNVIFEALLDHLHFSGTEKKQLQMITTIRNSFVYGDYPDVGEKPSFPQEASNNIIRKLIELIKKVSDKLHIKHHMKINRFIGKGVRGYMDFDIKFHNGLNFLIGINGTGKTTVIRLLKGLLQTAPKSMINIGFDEISVEFEDNGDLIKYESHIDDNNLTIRKFNNHTVTSDSLQVGLNEDSKNYSALSKFFSNIRGVSFLELDRLNDFSGDALKEISEKIYTFVRRNIATKNKIEEEFRDSVMMLAKISGGNKDKLLLKITENYNKDIDELNFPITRFETSANLFLSEGDKVMHVDEAGEIIIDFKNGGRRISIFELSSGEKQLMIMLGHLIFDNAEVLVIDEPELSLHLSWQMKFAEALQTASPNAQFILATHASGIVAKKSNEQYCIDLTPRQ